jgi:hypothetical protein
MNELIIEPTRKTLKIKCVKGLVEFSGCSIIDDPVPFFSSVIEWVKAYIKTPPQATVVNCKFDYVDTASFKFIFLIFKELEKINNDHGVSVNWYVENNDPEILELGEILESKVRFKFNYITS